MALAVSVRIWTTVAGCHGPTWGTGDRSGDGSVTLVALLGPRVAVIVVAVPLPEPGLVVVEERRWPDTHLALFQK